MTTQISTLTAEELIRFVDNKPDATDLERELAVRLAQSLDALDDEVTAEDIREALESVRDAASLLEAKLAPDDVIKCGGTD